MRTAMETFIEAPSGQNRRKSHL